MAFLKEKKSHFWVTRASVSKRGSLRSHRYENIIFILKQMKPLSQERLCTYPRFENEGFYYEPLDLLRRLGRYCVELNYGAVLALQLLLGNWAKFVPKTVPWCNSTQHQPPMANYIQIHAYFLSTRPRLFKSWITLSTR